jgi:hypothetical protein
MDDDDPEKDDTLGRSERREDREYGPHVPREVPEEHPNQDEAR